MRRNIPLFIGGIVFLALFNLTIAGVLVSLVFNLFSLSLAPVQQFLSELVTLLFWVLINRYYLKVRLNWQFKPHQLLYILPVLVVLLGDATLKPQFNFSFTAILTAIALGGAVGFVEEYVFRGLVVNFLTDHLHSGTGAAAALSGFAFAVIHLVNLSDGNSLNTLAQVLSAFGLGFFFAVIYLLTHNLWLPIIGHALIDIFDQLAFGTLSNTAGTSLLTSSLYLIFFTGLGLYLLRKKAPQLNFAHERPQFARKNVVPRPRIDLIATGLACLIPAVELWLGSFVPQLFAHRLGRVLITDVIFFAGFCGAIWLYRSVLRTDWREFKKHWFVNFIKAVGGVIASYAILLVVRSLLKPWLSSSGVPDVLSMQTATVTLIASLTVLMAPFTEEIIFRHALFYQWRNRGVLTWLMFVLSAILFGLVHWNNFDGNIVAMIPYMAVGAWYALIYYWSRNIWQNILTHFLFDFIQFLSALLLFILAFFGI